MPGAIGIAWINSTCARQSYRTSISEWFMNDAVSAVVRRLFCYCPKKLHFFKEVVVKLMLYFVMARVVQ